jgi:hypothetical protein
MATASVAQSMSQIGQQFAAGVGNTQKALQEGGKGGFADAAGGGASSAGSTSSPAAQVADNKQSAGDTGRDFNAEQEARLGKSASDAMNILQEARGPGEEVKPPEGKA